MRIERKLCDHSKRRQPHLGTTRKIRSAQRAFMAVNAFRQFTKTSLMELMSARQFTPAAIIRGMLIETNCTFRAQDFGFFESSNHFHNRCLVKLGILGIFVVIIQQHDCCAVMSRCFRFIHVVKIRCCTRSAGQTNRWQAHNAARAARMHRQ